MAQATPDAAAPFTFDFMFASGELAGRVRAMRVDTGRQGSDHQPLLLTVA